MELIDDIKVEVINKKCEMDIIFKINSNNKLFVRVIND